MNFRKLYTQLHFFKFRIEFIHLFALQNMLKMFGFFVADDSVSLLKNSQSIIICSSNKKREIYLT